MHALERFRLARGLTIVAMARGLEISHPHYLRLTKGEGDPSASLIRRAIAFTAGEVTADDMLRTTMYAEGTEVNDVGGAAPASSAA